MSLALARGDIAGATVAIVKDGRVLLTKGYGYADVERHVRVDADRHLFRVASISKLFTWTAVMQQVEQGKIDLDADINQYLDFRIPPYRGKPLTMRNLMTHTAGFELVMRDLFSSSADSQTLGERLKLWVPERIYAPGTTPTYSNYATALAGYIVQRVSGETFENYIERHILRPLDMSRSSFRQPPPAALAKDLSKGYLSGSGPSMPFEYTAHVPAGALSSTAPDIARFMIAHLNAGALGKNRILQARTARLMHTKLDAKLPPLHGMALGFSQHDINGHRVIAHDGDTRFFHSQLNLFIDDQVGIFVSVNSTGGDGGADILRTALFTQFADRYFPAMQIDGKVDGKVAPEVARRHARALSGHYVASDRSASNFLAINGFRYPTVVDVDSDGNLVIPAFTGLDGAPKQWREIAPFIWREVNGKDRLAAQVVDRQPVRFGIDEYAPLVVWDRLPWWRSTLWLKPFSQGALAILFLTIAAWPAGVAMRRFVGVPALLPARDRSVYLTLRLAALVGLIVPSLWLWTIGPIMTFTADADTIDMQIIAISLLTLIAYVGGLLLSLGNAWYAWKHRGPASRLWSLALVWSFALLVWIAWVFKLLSFSTDF